MKYFFTLAIFILFPLSISNAQVTNNATSDLSITLESDYISPFSEITASLNDYSIADQTTRIYWVIDGETRQELTNQRSIKLTTKDSGKATSLKAIIETTSGQTIETRKNITPTYLDIIVEPQTRIPSFYLGRSLPSIESTTNLIALIDGKGSSNYFYNWSLNNANLEGGPVRGKNSVAVKVPFGGYNVVTVVITNDQGELIARRSIELASVDPELVFYETNALSGIKHIPVKQSLNLIGDTANIKAEPYYLDINTYNRPHLIEWKVDGIRSPSSTGNPYEVTLARQGGSGISRIEFEVGNSVSILQGIRSEFKVNY